MTITGTSTSRLLELEKYNVTNIFLDKYVGGGNTINDGVDYISSNPLKHIVYYIGGIKYIDIISGTSIYSGYSSGTTLNIYIPQGVTPENFIDSQYYKNPNKEWIVGKPKINDDVFIVRQEVSAFEENYRLEHIKNLSDLLSYVGGNYYNIIDNI